MPTKAFDPTTGRVRVEFRLPPEAAAEQAWLCGDFNEWSLDATPMTRTGDGALVATLDLEAGRSYRFRYWLGADRWENDWAADAYVENDFGGHDSELTLPESSHPPAVDPASTDADASVADPVTPAGRAAAKKAAAKKAAATKGSATKGSATKGSAGKAAAKAPAKATSATKATPTKDTSKSGGPKQSG